jgi:RNA polymerase sigma-70 factor, ECF subfamily
MALDQTAFEACYRRLERPLYNVLFRWLWDAGACQDVLHDCFLKLWDRRDSIDPVALDGWVYTTALNLARNRLRWHRLRQWVGLEQAESADATLEASELGADGPRLRRALEALPGDERDVLLLSEFSGFDTAELATMLGIAPGTVGSRKHRALARLRRMLEER